MNGGLTRLRQRTWVAATAAGATALASVGFALLPSNYPAAARIHPAVWPNTDVAVSPSGRWVATQDVQTGAVRVVRVSGGPARRLGETLMIFPWVSTPWTMKPERLLLVDQRAGCNPSVLVLDPATGKTERITRSGSFSLPVCASPDGRFIAMGHYREDNITTSLGIWNLSGGGRWGYQEIPFRYNVEQIAWTSPSTLLAVTGGFDLGKEPLPFRQELFVVNVRTGRSRPLALGEGMRIWMVSPYADATGWVPLIASRGSRRLLACIAPASGTVKDIAELPAPGERWRLVWSNPDRLYLRSIAAPSGTEIMTYRPSLNSLSRSKEIGLEGGLSADMSGRIWGWKAGKIASIAPQD